MRLQFRTKLWPTLPGLAAATFAIASILLPVGRDGLGRHLGDAPGLLPTLGRWARDLHDGFWQRSDAPGAVLTFHRPLSAQRRRAQELCWLGQAREAVALYREIGVLTDSDRQALLELGARLICDANHDLGEWYVHEGDRLLGGAILRNNLAWHYTQLGIRPKQALALAAEAVADNRNACNLDTLAWAHYRSGSPGAAREMAQATLAVDAPWLTKLLSEQQELAKQSSRHLLTLLQAVKADPGAPAQWVSPLPQINVPVAVLAAPRAGQ